MNYRITFSGSVSGERTWVRQAVCAALVAEKTAPCEIEVQFTDDKGIRQLNAVHRGRDETTDVLSFPLVEPGAPLVREPDGSLPVLGSMAVNVSRCREQANEFGHSFRRELCYLAVHSVLHLLGYDHGNDEDKPVMREKEEQIMLTLRLTRDKSSTGFFGVADAARGLFGSIRRERNVRVHVAAIVSVTVLGVYLRIDRVSWALCAICFGLVLGLELCNSALEALCDKVECRSDALIRRCKDIAAGAVLAGCLASLGVAAAVFARPELWRGIQPIRTLIIGLAVALADTLLIFGGNWGGEHS